MGESRERKMLMSSVGTTRRALARQRDVSRVFWTSLVCSLIAAALVAWGSPPMQVIGLVVLVLVLAIPLMFWLRPRSTEPKQRPIVVQALELPFKIAMWALGAWYLLALGPLTEAARIDAFGTATLTKDMDPRVLGTGLARYWTTTSAPFIEIAIGGFLIVGVLAATFHARRLGRREIAATHVELTSLLSRCLGLVAPVLPQVRRFVVGAHLARGGAPKRASPIAMSSWVARRVLIDVSAASQTYVGAAGWMVSVCLLAAALGHLFR